MQLLTCKPAALTGCLFLLSLSLLTPAVAQKDPRAQTILDAVSRKYGSLTAYQATFVYASGGSGASQSYAGDLAVKGTRFRLKMNGQDVFSDGKTVSTYVKETNEVNVQDYEAGAMGDVNPAKIYSIYKKGFNYTFLREEKQKGRKVEVINLTPEKKNTQVANVQITVDKADRSIRSWQTTDKSGKVTTFRIGKFTPNAPLPDGFFMFDKSKYPGVEVVDLR
jgi:outer membrane lipoprotein-sorting protein